MKRGFRIVSCLLIALLLAGNAEFVKVQVSAATNEATVSNGYYQIATALNEKQVLDVKSASLSNRANVQLWENHDAGQQRFYIKKISNGYYTIQAFHSGKMLDVTGASSAIKTNVQQYASNNNAAQQWTFKSAGNGYYYIQSRLGTYLDCEMGYSKNGTNVWMYKYNGSNAQKWKLKKESGVLFVPSKTKNVNCRTNNCTMDVKASSTPSVKDNASWIGSYSYKSGKLKFKVAENFGGARKGTITLKCGDDLQYITVNQSKYTKPLANGLYTIGSKLNTKQRLDVKSQSKSNRASIQLWSDTGNNNQKWQLTYLGNGYYKIINCHSGKSLDVTGKSKKSKIYLQQWTYSKNNNNPAQLWRLHYITKDTFYLQSKLGTYVDAKDGKSKNGTRIWTYTLNGSKAQQWIFKPTKKKAEKSNEAKVKERLSDIAAGKVKYKEKGKNIRLKVGTKYNGVDQCKGYARRVFYLCFKVLAGSTKNGNYSLKDVKGMKKIATGSVGSEKAAKALFENARSGDFVQMRRSHGGPHSAIVYQVGKNSVTFLEANTDNHNTIMKNTYSWKTLKSKNQKMSVYTATDYKVKK